MWPYLLGLYKFGSSQSERDEKDEAYRRQYENTVSEWLVVEAIVRQQDQEMLEANLARLSSEAAGSGDIEKRPPPPSPARFLHKDSTLSNEVFLETFAVGAQNSEEDDGLSIPETVAEESASDSATPRQEKSRSVDDGRSAGINVISKAVQRVMERDHQVLKAVDSNDSKTTTASSTDDGLGDSLARGMSQSSSGDADHVGGRSSSTSSASKRQIFVTDATIDAVDCCDRHEVAEQTLKDDMSSDDIRHLLNGSLKGSQDGTFSFTMHSCSCNI